MADTIADIKASVDLGALVEADEGPPCRRSGRWLFWWCPFHQEHRAPSLGVTPDNGRFKCFGCGVAGDAIDWLVRRRGLSTAEAIRHLRDLRSTAPRAVRSTAPRAVAGRQGVTREEGPPPAQWQAAGRAFVAWAAGQLWQEAGAPGRAYLQAGGLREETVRRWGLGWNPAWMARDAERWGLGRGALWLPRGVVIPGQAAGALWYVKVRRFDEAGRPAARGKYPQVRGGVAALFGADELQGGERPLLLCEGERDALLAWQELGAAVDVASLGGAGRRHLGRWLLWLLPYRRILVAYDPDAAGERGAAYLAGLSRRVEVLRLPHGADVVDFWQAGGDLRSWLQAGEEHVLHV